MEEKWFLNMLQNSAGFVGIFLNFSFLFLKQYGSCGQQGKEIQLCYYEDNNSVAQLSVAGSENIDTHMPYGFNTISSLNNSPLLKKVIHERVSVFVQQK